jgi:hypothetical protein
MSAEAVSVILAKLLWGVPAAIGTIGSLFFIVPRTRIEFASFMAIGIGCGIYIGPLLPAIVPDWLPLSEVGSMFLSALLGTVVLRAVAIGVEKLPLADIAKGWLSKG